VRILTEKEKHQVFRAKLAEAQRALNDVRQQHLRQKHHFPPTLWGFPVVIVEEDHIPVESAN